MSFLLTLKPVNTGFTDILDFQSYLLINRDLRYEHYVAKRIPKTAKLLQGQMPHKTFDPSFPISVLNFLLIFKTTCDS